MKQPVTQRTPQSGAHKGKRRAPLRTWLEPFLNSLGTVPNVRLAARAAGVDHVTVYRHRNADPVFARRWDEALSDAVDALEGRAWLLASTEPSMARFLLQHWRPERYREVARHEVVGEGGGPVTFRVIYEERKTLVIPAARMVDGAAEITVERPDALPVLFPSPDGQANGEHPTALAPTPEVCPICKGPMPPRMPNGPPRETCSVACRMKKMRERKRNGINGK